MLLQRSQQMILYVKQKPYQINLIRFSYYINYLLAFFTGNSSNSQVFVTFQRNAFNTFWQFDV